MMIHQGVWMDIRLIISKFRIHNLITQMSFWKSYNTNILIYCHGLGQRSGYALVNPGKDYLSINGVRTNWWSIHLEVRRARNLDLRGSHREPRKVTRGIRLRNRARVAWAKRFQVRESDLDLVASPGCFLGPTLKALPVPPDLPRRCVSWSDAVLLWSVRLVMGSLGVRCLPDTKQYLNVALCWMTVSA